MLDGFGGTLILADDYVQLCSAKFLKIEIDR